MTHPRAVCDETFVRLQTLTARLTEHLGHAQNLRARLVRALEANAWPDVRSAFLRRDNGKEPAVLLRTGESTTRVLMQKMAFRTRR